MTLIMSIIMSSILFVCRLQILSDVSSRTQHGHDAVVLLALLVNYRKYEVRNHKFERSQIFMFGIVM